MLAGVIYHRIYILSAFDSVPCQDVTPLSFLFFSLICFVQCPAPALRENIFFDSTLQGNKLYEIETCAEKFKGKLTTELDDVLD
jgi:hypothetical protein